MRLIFAVLFTIATNTAFAQTTDENIGFHHESELGYIVVGGNTKTESFSGKQATRYQWDRDLIKLTGHYLSAKAQNQQTKNVEGTAENWSVALRGEHAFVPDKFNMFIQAGLTGDRFVGVELGQAYDLGGKYFWVANDSFKFFSELGYRYLHEDLEKSGITGELESHFIRFYTQLDYIYSPSIKFGVWVEYLPDMKNEDNYRFNFSPYMLAILSNTFSLKFGYEGYYRNLPVPPNTVRLDFRHVTALIAKF